jgi:hypothetical protein
MTGSLFQFIWKNDDDSYEVGAMNDLMNRAGVGSGSNEAINDHREQY